MLSREPAGLFCHGAVGVSSLLLLAMSGCGGGDGGIQIPPTKGTLQIITTTAGDEPDPDGYTVQLDGEAPQPIGAAGTVARSELEPGDHTIRLDGLAPNCSAAENPRTVQIDAGQTTTSTFAIACSATTGGVLITTVTAGAAPDPDGYGVVLDGADQGPIPASGQLSLTGLALGSHVVGLSGMAGNCSVQGDNLRAVTVTPGSSAPVDYALTCSAPPANAGTLRIITVTTGDSPDPDGYSFLLDLGENQPIAANATATITNLAAGAHRVQLTGLSDNCQVQGDNPRTVNVPGGGTNDVTFNVTCIRPNGSIRVTVATTGSPADPNGYRAKLDNAEPGELVDVDGSVRFNDVGVGSHTITLADVAENCSVREGPSRQVAVTTGRTADVRFAVTCGQTGGGSGSILVATETSGSDLDPDGYSVLVNGNALASVPATGQQAIQDLPPANYVVQLDGVAGNCQIAGSNARVVTVVDAQSSSVNYTITCTALPEERGSLEVITTTSGAEQDNNGYDFIVDGVSHHINPDGNVTVTDLPPGDRTLELTDIAANCSVEESNPQTVTVNGGQPATVRFTINCSATTGRINVTVSTTGEDLDSDGYTVTLDAGSGMSVKDDTPATFENVTPGHHELALGGLADNCSVQNNNQSVDLSAGEQENVQFDVVCSAAATNTSPNAENDSYTVSGGTQFRVPSEGAPGLLANDSDLDGDNLSTVPEAKSTREQGNVVIGGDGSFDYTPAEGFTGADSFEYTVTDGRGGESTGVATIQVNPAQ